MLAIHATIENNTDYVCGHIQNALFACGNRIAMLLLNSVLDGTLSQRRAA